MTAPARLLALRLHGFKSFAERTVVEFGPGISAIVGPNGSGKSNLADALRWALGEQGRALRSRKAEDVIWAGSERRAAVGMADVTLLLDNSDNLLPVEYSAIELGRRLFRSGENDYLLNRQRVRLRDLIDLLDAANLADNAFLFIGQGMVDQALALRPDERRPLFEEVAGVRGHERRRRKAEEQLAESEDNLARVHDILAELRPQARRLAIQAEQQATRATAGAELADALLVAAHARWHEAAGRLAAAASDRSAAVAGAASAAARAREAEGALAEAAGALRDRAKAEVDLRARHEVARATLTALQLREARLITEREAIARDRSRLAAERAAAEEDLAAQRRVLAMGVPARDLQSEARLAAADRSLGEALEELARIQSAGRARDEEAAAVRRAAASRQADLEAARRRVADAERRIADEVERLSSLRDREHQLGRRAAAAKEALDAALAAEAGATEERERAASTAEAAERRHRAAAEQAAGVATRLATLGARIGEVATRLEHETGDGLAAAVQARGGRLVARDLLAERSLANAVDAALGDAGRAVLIARSAVAGLAELGEGRGTVIVSEAAARAGREERDDEFLARVVEHGGGALSDAIERDATGAVRAMLVRAAWLPSLDACLELQPRMPRDWLLATRDGSAVVTAMTVSFVASDGIVRRQAELDRLRSDADRLARERREVERVATAAADDRRAAVEALETMRRAEAGATTARRSAEDTERIAERELEAIVRERTWAEALVERLSIEVERARATVAGTETAAPVSPGGGTAAAASAATSAWQARVEQLRGERDRAAADAAASERARAEAESRRARAEAAVALDEDRISRADREQDALTERASELAAERQRLTLELSVASADEARERQMLEALLAAESADRERLATAERDAAAARDLVRRSEERLRATDHAELEARLAIESLREQVLVELAALGDLALEHLRRVAPHPAAAASADNAGEDGDGLDEPGEGVDPDSAAFQAALDGAARTWAVNPPPADPPSSARLAILRRRYHELGAANPFAVEEYAELRRRLEELETQESDLRTAIARTRDLIDELNGLIGKQFTTTFRALEDAFDRRFNQLFGGGYARLSLTDPSDLAQTGVEIVARPPGKKAQGLAMLSGGERALTAVALLFAMLEVRPVPFCVLDEVDAALDEANVGRFSAALRSLADRTQFIVITHNRGTIEIADALYGVTVGEDSVSRVISLRLDEAQAIAERQSGRNPQPLARAAVIG